MAWWDQGLAAAGESLSRVAAVAGVEAIRADAEERRLALAAEIAAGGDARRHGYAMEQQKGEQDFQRPAQEAQIEANKAQVDKYRVDTEIAKAEDARKREAIAIARGDTGGGTSGGITDNNIGNVRPVGKNTGFQQVASFDEGVALAVNNARAYPKAYNDGKPMTLVQIGEKWAPRGDGANDPVQWAKNVASIGGLPVDQPLNLNDPETAAKFARGVHGAEKGSNKVQPLEAYMPGVTGRFEMQRTGGGTTNAMSPEDRRQYDAMVAAGDLKGAAEFRLRWQQEQNKQNAPPDGAKLAEWWRKATPEQRQAMSDVLDMQRERKAPPEALVGYEPDPDRPGGLRPIKGGPRDPDQIGRTEAAKEGAKIKTATDEQNKAAGFADRMVESNRLLSTLDRQGANVWQRLFDAAGTAGNLFAKSEEYQKFEQAKRDFVNAVLRRESGAVISEAEFQNADKQYFPRPGDSAEVIAQKAKSRQIALDGMIRSAGPSYKPPAASRAEETPTAAAITATNPATGEKLMLQNGRWVPMP